jgi:DegV family protein with EDD domain
MKKDKIAWITDSTATLSQEFMKQHDVYMIPLYINFGEESYRENIDITAEDFYEKLSQSKELPKTSQPSIGEFIKLYERLNEEYTHAIAIHASSALTGTYQGSISASQTTDIHVEVIDSKIGSFALGQMIEKGIELEENGLDYDKIVEVLRELPEKGRLYMSPGSLEQLYKGGRVSLAQTFLSNLINLKLIIKFDDGKAILHEKIRSDKKVKRRLFEIFDAESHLVKKASVIHGNVIDLANRWKEELEQLYPHIEFTTTMFSPVPGVHTGQGTIGISWINE